VFQIRNQPEKGCQERERKTRKRVTGEGGREGGRDLKKERPRERKGCQEKERETEKRVTEGGREGGKERLTERETEREIMMSRICAGRVPRRRRAASCHHDLTAADTLCNGLDNDDCFYYLKKWSSALIGGSICSNLSGFEVSVLFDLGRGRSASNSRRNGLNLVTQQVHRTRWVRVSCLGSTRVGSQQVDQHHNSNPYVRIHAAIVLNCARCMRTHICC